MLYAEVLLAHGFARKNILTYEVDPSLELKIGDGVLVPFQKGEQAGLILGLSENAPEFKTKTITQKHSESPLLETWQIELMEWMSEYYFCSKYDVARLMLPKHIFRTPRKKRTLNKKTDQIRDEEFKKLTEKQADILNNFIRQKEKVGLLHGITGSGKTEIYKHLIKKNIQESKGTILLVPEISLTPQFVQYFKGTFPRMGIWHSQISEGEKASLWRAVKNNEIDLIIGSRSALFCPFKRLGSILIDEEHEWTYKQDQSPRYHARAVAEKIGDLTCAKILLGSATPSLESRWNAEQKKYAYYTLKERIGQTALPHVKLIDMREELKKGNMSILSEELEQKIYSTIAAGEQVVLFLNRRGAGSSTVCRDCGWTVKCQHCELPLTYHAKQFGFAKLICHHCGITEKIPLRCPKCTSIRIKHLGTGTEKVEMELQKKFPTAITRRADKDTMSQKGKVAALHAELQGESIDILLGTQMIAKGWDLPRVTLVGVLLADIGLSIPDFRTSERIFQLLTQVAGRAGRRAKQGEVLIQTYNPTHISLEAAKTQDSDVFFEQEIRSREDALLPPFSQLIKVSFLNKNYEQAGLTAQALQVWIQKTLQDGKDSSVFSVSAAPAFIRPSRNEYAWNVLIASKNAHDTLKKIPQKLLENGRIDIDPMVCI